MPCRIDTHKGRKHPSIPLFFYPYSTLEQASHPKTGGSTGRGGPVPSAFTRRGEKYFSLPAYGHPSGENATAEPPAAPTHARTQPPPAGRAYGAGNASHSRERRLHGPRWAPSAASEPTAKSGDPLRPAGLWGRREVSRPRRRRRGYSTPRRTMARTAAATIFPGALLRPLGPQDAPAPAAADDDVVDAEVVDEEDERK